MSAALSADAKLSMLREIMAARRIDAYIVPSQDDHFSEYLADCDKRRAYISNFDGSAGVAVVTAKEAKLWTDGRYWLQASQQLSQQWDLMKQGQTETPKVSEWVAKLDKPARIGVDPRLLPLSEYNKLKEAVKPKPKKKKAAETDSAANYSTIVPLEENFVDLVWATETSAAAGRPARTANPVFALDEQYAGSGLKMKLDDMRSKMDKIGASALVVSMLDEVAWLFNLRGSDIEYNPVFFAYAILTPSDCTLFAQDASLTSEVKQYLEKSSVRVQPYESIWKALEALGEKSQVQLDAAEESTAGGEEKEAAGKVLVGKQTSAAVVHAIGEDRVHIAQSPISTAKSIKNDTEIEGFRQCHIRDGAALVRYFAWLEEQLEGGAKLSEFDAATRLEEFRKAGDLFKGLSFDTISSTGPNGAIIHYKPSSTDSHIIDKNEIYLCDSGAQYLDGTTDTTRTLHFGKPRDEEVRAFTRVLQGHIAIDTVVFPVGTSGFQLDVFARKALWEDGLDYRHGTGHGIGSFLNVHEGPQGIGMNILYHDTPLKEGMVISNEPGYYADGKFGIRIENVIVVRSARTPNNFGDKGYLTMEHVTMVPIQSSLVDASLLVPAEKAWLNAYHAEVLDKVRPLLQEKGDARAVRWLERECRAI